MDAKPKKILVFSLAYHPFIGGAEVALHEIVERIAPADIEFHLITLRFDRRWPCYERVGHMHVHRIGFGARGASAAETFSPLFYLSKMLFVPLAAWSGMRLHRTHHFDALWAMMSYMLLPIVLMRASGIRIPYLLTLQEGDTFERTFKRARIAPFLPFIKSGFRHARVVQAISTYLGGWARQMGFEGPLEVVPNGVDGTHFSHTSASVHEARKEMGVPDDVLLLISVSRLVRKNGVDTIIRALPELSEGHLLVLGDGPERENLLRLARELGVDTRVVLRDFVPHRDLPRYLHAADIFVRPSRSEGMGNVFIEAFAAGVPVIATQAGGISDFLFDEEKNPDTEPTGWAVGVDAPEDIVRHARFIKENPEKRARVVARARELALSRFDWDTIARDMQTRVFAPLLS